MPVVTGCACCMLHDSQAWKSRLDATSLISCSTFTFVLTHFLITASAKEGKKETALQKYNIIKGM